MVAEVGATKERLDRALVLHGFAQSRESASRLVLAGEVKVDGMIVDKPAKLVPADAKIEVIGPASPFVSRGGEKLKAGLDAFGIDPAGSVCLDVGCSTGGFTDCLLQRGAARVYAVDVGYGQFDWRLRQDSRVVLLERTNIRHLDRRTVPERIDVAVVDVSFISLTLVLPVVVSFLRPGGTALTLVKPQFEVGKGKVGRGGVVRDEAQRQAVKEHVIEHARRLGLQVLGAIDSPIEGRKGNREILVAFGLQAASESN